MKAESQIAHSHQLVSSLIYRLSSKKGVWIMSSPRESWSLSARMELLMNVVAKCSGTILLGRSKAVLASRLCGPQVQFTKIKAASGIYITDSEILINCIMTIMIHLQTAALSSVRLRATIFPPKGWFLKKHSFWEAKLFSSKAFLSSNRSSVSAQNRNKRDYCVRGDACNNWTQPRYINNENAHSSGKTRGGKKITSKLPLPDIKKAI